MKPCAGVRDGGKKRKVYGSSTYLGASSGDMEL